MKTYAAIFASVLLAELGDKTQLATLLFATSPELSRAGIFLAAAAALVTSTLLAVLIGARLGQVVAPAHMRTIAGAAFVAIGIWMLLPRA
ncbi:MAG TPA: TMEM165/GDT1 family protein [Methylomirabilota bacterium]|jgi:putative Ca2+/H+ antiporter (TMEM165/GDT1 family)|nr:TMEM165/GDT1 family protein [Methylomirabilota bacterium]